MGGYRAGAGRPKGSKNKTKPIVIGGNSAGLTPLEHMLAVMNNLDEDKDLRARMAVAAAPYLHCKADEAGKKEQKNKAAKEAEGGKFAPAAAPKLVVNNR